MSDGTLARRLAGAAFLRADTVREADWPFERAPGWGAPQFGAAGAIRNQSVRGA